MKHVVECQQFSPEWLLDEFFPMVRGIKSVPVTSLLSSLEGKIVALVFYVPSIRTRLSFELAARKLGCAVVETEDAGKFSSIMPNENLEDTIRFLVGHKVDLIVLRYDHEGGAQRAVEISKIPIINAGETGGQHPSQALVDLFTLYDKLGRLDNIHVAIVGGLSKGRTARSLAYLLAKFKGVKLTFVSPPNGKMSDEVLDYLSRHGVSYCETNNLRAVAPEADAIYMIQTGRAFDSHEYHQNRGCYGIDPAMVETTKEGAIILHPFPRDASRELPFEIDSSPKAAYFEQSDNALYFRMALLHLLML